MPANEKDLSQTKFTITNFNEVYALDANVNDTLVTSDVLATLIRDLAEKGIINPSAAVS